LDAMSGAVVESLEPQDALRYVRALAPASPILLLDEPFSDLDAAFVERVADVVQEEADITGATVLLAAHDLVAAAKVCSQVAVLRGGRLHHGPGPWAGTGVLPEGWAR